MFETIAKVFAVDVDLGKTIKKTYLDTLFATDDSEAHRFNIILYRDNEKLTIPSGATVSAYFIRYGDDVTIPLTGSADGNVVSVTLKKSCYNKAGQFALIIKVTTGSETSTVFYGEGAIFTSSTDTILDDEHIIPSLAELLAQIDAMEAATASANTAIGNANTATDNANEAAGNANTAANTANTAADNANEATGNANTAADTANAAAGKIDSMTVTATTLETGSPATAALSTVDGHYQLNLGLPKGNTGNTGATPQISVQVETGAAGSEAHVSVSGTAEEPVIRLTIPKGDTGDIGALTINGKTPDAAGSVTLGIGDIDGLQTAIESAGSVKTVAGKAPDEAGNVAISAADVGARESDWMPTAAQVGAASTEEVSALKSDKLDKTATAVDSDKLGGKAPEYYLQPRNFLDNSDFTNPVNQRDGKSYSLTSDGSIYTIDRWILYSSSTATMALTDAGLIFSGSGMLLQRYDSGILPDTLTIVAKFGDGSETLIHTKYTLSDGVTEEIRIPFTDGQTLVWAALYKGTYTADTLPQYVPKGYAAELAECQRYYQYYKLASYPVSVWGDSTTQASITIFMPTLMRVNRPTITIGNPEVFIDGSGNAKTLSSFGSLNGNMNSSSFRIRVATTTAWTKGDTGVFIATVSLSADL